MASLDDIYRLDVNERLNRATQSLNAAIEIHRANTNTALVIAANGLAVKRQHLYQRLMDHGLGQPQEVAPVTLGASSLLSATPGEATSA